MKKQAEKRIQTIRRHLTSDITVTRKDLDEIPSSSKAWQGVDPKNVDIKKKGTPLPPIVRGKILHFFDQIEDRRTINGVDISKTLPGPSPRDVGKTGGRYADIKDLLREIQIAENNGTNHLLWDQMQDRYCRGDRSANFVIPVISFTRLNDRPPILANKIILSHPDDSRRIARTHVQKMPDQGIFLGTGVLTQLDNERWRRQRAHLNEVFLPEQSLRRLMPLSVRRAKESADRLMTQIGHENGVVQMNEFLLNETMAQLLLLLFGLPSKVVEKYNKPVRDAFAELLEATGGTGGGAAENMDMKMVMEKSQVVMSFVGKVLRNAPMTVGVKEIFSSDSNQTVPTYSHSDSSKTLRGQFGLDGIQGPLSARLNDIRTSESGKKSDTIQERVFNAATFVFAGHDTTANTMSWLLFEISQKPTYQARIRKEVDDLYAYVSSQGRDIEYRDLKRLPFMTKCIAETLRLWPVVPNGTFRQLQFDDTVTGPDNKPVHVPKGTFVQIVNWMRHRDPKLWGSDANEFNPDRVWQEEELWGSSHFPLGGFNPASDRYSPFTFAPRDCMGKNFAQMEMRVILCSLFKRFWFDLAPPTSTFNRKTFLGVNRATLGPRDIGVDPTKPARLGLYLRLTPRYL